MGRYHAGTLLLSLMLWGLIWVQSILPGKQPSIMLFGNRDGRALCLNPLMHPLILGNWYVFVCLVFKMAWACIWFGNRFKKLLYLCDATRMRHSIKLVPLTAGAPLVNALLCLRELRGCLIVQTSRPLNWYFIALPGWFSFIVEPLGLWRRGTQGWFLSWGILSEYRLPLDPVCDQGARQLLGICLAKV